MSERRYSSITVHCDELDDELDLTSWGSQPAPFAPDVGDVVLWILDYPDEPDRRQESLRFVVRRRYIEVYQGLSSTGQTEEGINLHLVCDLMQRVDGVVFDLGEPGR